MKIKDGSTKPLPPVNVNIKCPEVEQLASGIEAQRTYSNKVIVSFTEKAGLHGKEKEMMVQNKNSNNSKVKADKDKRGWILGS